MNRKKNRTHPDIISTEQKSKYNSISLGPFHSFRKIGLFIKNPVGVLSKLCVFGQSRSECFGTILGPSAVGVSPFVVRSDSYEIGLQLESHWVRSDVFGLLSDRYTSNSTNLFGSIASASIDACHAYIWFYHRWSSRYNIICSWNH